MCGLFYIIIITGEGRYVKVVKVSIHFSVLFTFSPLLVTTI